MSIQGDIKIKYQNTFRVGETRDFYKGTSFR